MHTGPGSWLKNYIQNKYPTEEIKVSVAEMESESKMLSGPEFEFDDL